MRCRLIYKSAQAYVSSTTKQILNLAYVIHRQQQQWIKFSVTDKLNQINIVCRYKLCFSINVSVLFTLCAGHEPNRSTMEARCGHGVHDVHLSGPWEARGVSSQSSS